MRNKSWKYVINAMEYEHNSFVYAVSTQIQCFSCHGWLCKVYVWQHQNDNVDCFATCFCVIDESFSSFQQINRNLFKWENETVASRQIFYIWYSKWLIIGSSSINWKWLINDHWCGSEIKIPILLIKTSISCTECNPTFSSSVQINKYFPLYFYDFW